LFEEDREERHMRLTQQIKLDIAKTVAEAMIAKRRDAAYRVLQKELTAIAERQFAGVPVDDMRKYSEYINFDNNLRPGKGYPDDFISNERLPIYKELGFVQSFDISLLKKFPCKRNTYGSICLCNKYDKDYTKAVRKYMLLYFEAESNRKIIFRSLENISTEKQLSDNLPELLEFYIIPKNKKEAKEVKDLSMSDENVKRCKKLLQKERGVTE
jgi:hypothetical protein